MDLFDLADQLKATNGAAGFSAVSQDKGYQHCEFEHWDNSPVPDFAEQLPDELIDPATGKTVYISQSMIKELRKMAMQELCPKRFYAVYVSKEYQEPETEGNAMHMGRRFEFELTGARDYYGNMPGQLLTAKTGKPSAEQKRITENVRLARQTLIRLGVPLDKEIQKALTFKCLKGTADIFYRFPAMGVGIDDLKYSGLLGDTNKHSPLSWHIDKIGDQFSHLCQACHYSLIALLCGADEVRFRFIVFDNRKGKEGRYQVFQMNLSESKLNEHRNLILLVIKELQGRFGGEGFSAVPSYSKCEGCPVSSDCPDYVQFPEVYEVGV